MKRQQDKLYEVLKKEGFVRIISSKKRDIPSSMFFMVNKQTKDYITIGIRGFVKIGDNFDKLFPMSSKRKKMLLAKF